jgi:serine/threonine-protein kinase HipA
MSFGGERVICVERYDRVLANGRWWRVHQEDLCQAAGLDPRVKYESQGGPGVAQCGALIRERCGPTDVEAFARASLFNYLIKGSDAHSRNYSILITPGDVRLAPLYDLNTTLGFGHAGEANQMAMGIGGEDRFAQVSRGNWRLFATSLRLSEDWVLHELATMAERLPDALATVCAGEDLSGLADATLRRLQDRAAEWVLPISVGTFGTSRT